MARWQAGQIGFHEGRPNAWLLKFFDHLGLAPGDRIFVPLCGKSQDMNWLQSRGMVVSGVEISEKAVSEFFRESGRFACDVPVGALVAWRSGDIEIHCGDFFAMTPDRLPSVRAAYDRAALIALPPEMRPAYIDKLASLLPTGARVLLITMEYEQAQMSGPPFAVMEQEIRLLCRDHFQLQALARESILEQEPRFKTRGLSYLDEVVYMLERI